LGKRRRCLNEKFVQTKGLEKCGPVQRDAEEVMAELVAGLSQKLDTRPTLSVMKANVDRALKSNRNRLAVGVDLGQMEQLVHSGVGWRNA